VTTDDGIDPVHLHRAANVLKDFHPVNRRGGDFRRFGKPQNVGGVQTKMPSTGSGPGFRNQWGNVLWNEIESPASRV
jgi:hypothetical protein